MNNNELLEIEQALNLTHSSTTAQTKRKDLYEYIESKTADIFLCKRMGYHFIKSDKDHLRLFGYHCIRKVAKKWFNLQQKDKNDLKHLSMTLFKFNVNNTQNCNLTLLKEKIAELLVIMTTNSWPIEWPSLFDQLFKISQNNPISLEILFIILKDIYFVCGDRQLIPEKRKKRIKDELMKNNQKIMQIFSVTLIQCYQQIFIDTNNNNNNNNNIALARNILRRCLEAMPKYLNQFPLKVILNSQVLIGLVKILQSVAKTSNDSNVPLCYDEFYRYGLLSVIYFFMRKFSELNTYETEEKYKQEAMILNVWNIEMETAKGLYIMTHSNNKANNNNLALQRLDNNLECMIRKLKLFNRLLIPSTNNNDKNAQSIRDIFLGLSECGMKSSDLRIRLRSMSIWSYVLEEDNLLQLVGFDINKPKYAQNDKFTNVIIGIMKYVLNHFRVKFHDLKSFETEEEWQNSRNTLRSKISRLLQQCFVLCPFRGMECIGQYTLSILSTDNKNNDTKNLNSIGHCTINNEKYIAMDGLCDVYRIIFENSINYKFNKTKAMKRKKMAQHIALLDESVFDNNSPLIKMLEQIHGIILNWSCNNDTQLMSRIYPLLSSLIPLYCRQPKYLQITFERLLTDFPKLLPLNPTANDSFDIKCNAVSCKRRIAFSLLHIAKRIPHICVQYIEPIWKQVMEIIKANFSTFTDINNKNKPQNGTSTNGHSNNGIIMASIMELSEGPVCHLFELLVCISNGLSDPNKRSKVLSDLLKDVVDNFNSSEIQNVLNDSKQFANMIQFPMSTHNNANDQQSVHNVDQRIRFAYHIRTILNILQSTLTASLLSEGQTGLKDLFHTANLDGMPNVFDNKNGSTIFNSASNKPKEIPSWPLFIAVFPNVLKLNKLLSFIYTPQFKTLLSQNYYAITKSLDVKSLYNLYGLKHDELIRNPTSKPKEIIPLEKAVIWIQNVRDYVSRIIAVASYFDDQFFSNEKAMEMVTESMIAYSNELPLSHLAIMIKHFFMNFIQLCSPKYYPNLLQFLYKFLTIYFKKLDQSWQKYINDFIQNNRPNNNQQNTTNGLSNISFSKNKRENSSCLRDEVYHEFALRDSSQKLWMALAMITISHKERGFILLHDDKINKRFRKKQQKLTPPKNINNFNDDFNNDFLKNFGSKFMDKYQIDNNDNNDDNHNNDKNKNKNKEEINLKQDKLVMLILQNENLCKCIISGIKTSLNWLDNSCHVRISQVASKFVAFIAKYRMKHLYNECGNIFKATLNALSRNKLGDNQANAELNILCVTIGQLLGPLCSNIIINILQGVPNVDMEDAKNLCNLISSSPGKHPNVSYRQSIKSFTAKYVIGKQNVLSSS